MRVFTIETMARRLNPKKALQGGLLKPGIEKLVAVTIDVTPEIKAKLEGIARERNISFSDAGSLVLEEAVRKRMALEKTVDKMVSEALEDEFNRLAGPLLFNMSRSKGKKSFSS